MRSEWREVKLKDVLLEKGYIRGPFGSALRRGELLNSGPIPVYEQMHAIDGIRDFRYYIDDAKYESLKRFTVRSGDLIVSCSGTVGCISTIKPDDPIGIVSQALLILRADPRIILPEYLRYYLTSPEGQHAIISRSSGSVQVNIARKAVIIAIDFLLPPLEIQKAIVDTLSCLDAKIELNSKSNRNLEAQAQAIFKSRFVDFEPFQDGESVESEWVLIPEGWELRHFGDFVIPRVERDNNPLTPMYSVTNTGIHLRDRIFKKQLASSQTRNKVLRKGDLVFGMSREILNWGVMKDKIGEVSSAYHIYEIDQSVVESWYLELFISQQIVYFSDLIRPASREGQGVDRDLLPRKLIYIPPSKWLNHYFDIWVSIKSAQGSNEVQNSTLKNIRDTLLPKLMSGEIEVPID